MRASRSQEVSVLILIRKGSIVEEEGGVEWGGGQGLQMLTSDSSCSSLIVLTFYKLQAGKIHFVRNKSIQGPQTLIPTVKMLLT